MGRKRESENEPGNRNMSSRLTGQPVRACLRWIGKLRGKEIVPPRLTLVERIALAPRQSLALVEAEGRRFLVATSPEGAPAFYALDESRSGRFRASARSTPRDPARVSW
jgi:hypothetical protein